MSIFRQLTEKPWETVPGRAADAGGGGVFALPIPKVALVIFLCVVTILFWLFGLVYFERMEVNDWTPLLEPGLPSPCSEVSFAGCSHPPHPAR